VGPVLETKRLILRIPTADDFEGWAAFVGDPQTARFVGGVLPRSLAWRNLATMVGAWSLRGFAMFSVIERKTGNFIGRLGPWYPEGWPGREVGWGLVRSAWGHGYAVEGSTAAIDWAFDTLGWDEVIHCIHPDNARSKAVATRLGSRYRGLDQLPAPFDDGPTEIWGQTRREWSERPSSAAAD
jgi:RimJ/RimL family protein N-acetyltransferase